MQNCRFWAGHSADQQQPDFGGSRLAVVASKDHAGPQVARLLERTPGAALKSMGSSLKFCLLAEGQADFYPRLGPTSEWDTAAAHAVVLAAGGLIVTNDATIAERIAMGCELEGKPSK